MALTDTLRGVAGGVADRLGASAAGGSSMHDQVKDLRETQNRPSSERSFIARGLRWMWAAGSELEQQSAPNRVFVDSRLVDPDPGRSTEAVLAGLASRNPEMAPAYWERHSLAKWGMDELELVLRHNDDRSPQAAARRAWSLGGAHSHNIFGTPIYTAFGLRRGGWAHESNFQYMVEGRITEDFKWLDRTNFEGPQQQLAALQQAYASLRHLNVMGVNFGRRGQGAGEGETTGTNLPWSPESILLSPERKREEYALRQEIRKNASLEYSYNWDGRRIVYNHDFEAYDADPLNMGRFEDVQANIALLRRTGTYVNAKGEETPATQAEALGNPNIAIYDEISEDYEERIQVLEEDRNRVRSQLRGLRARQRSHEDTLSDPDATAEATEAAQNDLNATMARIKFVSERESKLSSDLKSTKDELKAAWRPYFPPEGDPKSNELELQVEENWLVLQARKSGLIDKQRNPLPLSDWANPDFREHKARIYWKRSKRTLGVAAGVTTAFTVSVNYLFGTNLSMLALGKGALLVAGNLALNPFTWVVLAAGGTAWWLGRRYIQRKKRLRNQFKKDMDTLEQKKTKVPGKPKGDGHEPPSKGNRPKPRPPGPDDDEPDDDGPSDGNDGVPPLPPPPGRRADESGPTVIIFDRNRQGPQPPPVSPYDYLSGGMHRGLPPEDGDQATNLYSDSADSSLKASSMPVSPEAEAAYGGPVSSNIPNADDLSTMERAHRVERARRVIDLVEKLEQNGRGFADIVQANWKISPKLIAQLNNQRGMSAANPDVQGLEPISTPPATSSGSNAVRPREKQQVSNGAEAPRLSRSV